MSLHAAARVNRALEPVAPLVAVAEALLRAARRANRERKRQRYGSTLRPGDGTPLWNALVLSVVPLLRPYGAKSRLARLLGVPPQRIHDYFVRRHSTPDAERTLQLMYWLSQRRQGINPG